MPEVAVPTRVESLVSVVVPCYRCSATIARAVASVAAQTVRPSELILVEDGSDDGTTLAKLVRLREEFGADWVKIIPLPRHAGPSAARNVGWDAAVGTYVAFLDADDAWHPRKLERQLSWMEAHPDIALSGHRSRQLRDGDPLDQPVPPAGVRRIRWLELLLSNQFITPSVIVRRDLAWRFDPMQRHMEDHMLWLRVLHAGHRVARMEEALAFTYKAPYGESGLTADLLAMERAELSNYRRLFAEKAIGPVALMALWTWSSAKFLRRLAVVAARNYLLRHRNSSENQASK